MKGRSVIGIFALTLLSAVCLAASPALAATPQIAAGIEHNVALMADGTVWTWGANGSGQLCTGTAGGASSEPQKTATW